jgi:ribosomal-protein-alanine N-acetyltransferase
MVAMLSEARPELRAMQVTDLESVVAIEAIAYDFPWTIGIFRDCLRAGYESWTLSVAGIIVGYGVLSIAAGEAHLLNACISPAAQNRGYGRHLVGRMIEIARWHRVQRIFSRSAPVESRRARPLCEPRLQRDCHAAQLLPGKERSRGCDRHGDGTPSAGIRRPVSPSISVARRQGER